MYTIYGFESRLVGTFRVRFVNTSVKPNVKSNIIKLNIFCFLYYKISC